MPVLPVAGSKLKECYHISGAIFYIPKSVCLVKGEVLYGVNKSQMQPTSGSQQLHTYTLAESLVGVSFGRGKIVGSI